jgi:hypothetical protein
MTEAAFTIPIQKGSLNEEQALDSDLDIRPKLSAVQNIAHFRHGILEPRRSDMQQLIARHLGLRESEFFLSDSSDWITGSFNMCIPVDINTRRKPELPVQAILRFPLPFAVGETFRPGSMDEKLRCEAATYIWLRENCPSVPIPRLLGMAFPGTQTVTASDYDINASFSLADWKGKSSSQQWSMNL